MNPVDAQVIANVEIDLRKANVPGAARHWTATTIGEVVRALHAYNATLRPLGEPLVAAMIRELRESSWPESKIAQILMALDRARGPDPVPATPAPDDASTLAALNAALGPNRQPSADLASAIAAVRELAVEMHDVHQAIEGGLGVMTATPARTIRERGGELQREVSRLEERAQVHLQTIANISQSTPLDDEVKSAIEARGKLLAEVGTLRSRVFDLEVEKGALELQVSAIKDRSVALHQVWFGKPGALTPEILTVEHERFHMLKNELEAARDQIRTLAGHLIAMNNAVIDRMQAEAEVEKASQDFENVLEAAANELDKLEPDLRIPRDVKEDSHG